MNSIEDPRPTAGDVQDPVGAGRRPADPVPETDVSRIRKGKKKKISATSKTGPVHPPSATVGSLDDHAVVPDPTVIAAGLPEPAADDPMREPKKRKDRTKAEPSPAAASRCWPAPPKAP